MKYLSHSCTVARMGRRTLAAVTVAVLAACGGGGVDAPDSRAMPLSAGTKTAGATSAGAAAAQSSNIVTEALKINGETGLFDTLLAAATCPSLDGAIVDTLTARGQRTLFAPTDDAFLALGLTPDNVCNALAAGVLADVLSYHVTNGRRDAASVLDATQLRMLNGDPVQQSGGALIDGLGRTANIVVTDVAAGNGIIHAIDSVLLPPGFGS